MGKEVVAVEGDGGSAHHLFQQARQFLSPLASPLDEVQRYEAPGVPDVPHQQLKKGCPLAGVHGVGYRDEGRFAGAEAGEAGRARRVQMEGDFQPRQKVFDPRACRGALGVGLKPDAAGVLIEAQLPQGTLHPEDAPVLLQELHIQLGRSAVYRLVQPEDEVEVGVGLSDLGLLPALHPQKL